MRVNTVFLKSRRFKKAFHYIDHSGSLCLGRVSRNKTQKSLTLLRGFLFSAPPARL
jgi:hypothetical protein